MKPELAAVWLTVVLTSSIAVIAQQPIQDICSSIGAVAGWNVVITLPTGFDVQQCKNKFFKVSIPSNPRLSLPLIPGLTYSSSMAASRTSISRALAQPPENRSESVNRNVY